MYSLMQFMEMFPDDVTCLEYVFRKRFPDTLGYQRIKARPAYVNKRTGHHIHPLAGTVFEKTRTPLRIWFYAIYLFSISKNGVAAKELQRHFGVTYKTALRMTRKIRSLMYQDEFQLTGTVEADETYVGGRRRSTARFKNKAVVLGAVQRGGQVRCITTPTRNEYDVIPFITKNVRDGSMLYTDEARVYRATKRYGRGTVQHSKHQYVDGDVHTNTIEGFWGQFKRSIHGTYHNVSREHLASYLDEFAFRYNYRSGAFDKLMERI